MRKRQLKNRIEELEAEVKELRSLFKTIGADLTVTANLTDDCYKTVVDDTISAMMLLPYNPNDVKLLRVIVDKLEKHKSALEAFS